MEPIKNENKAPQENISTSHNGAQPEKQSAKPVSPGNGKVAPRYRSLLWFTLVLLIVGAIWLCYWFFYLQYYQWTDDAYANGSMIKINSAIGGSVVAFYADDTDLVTEGQLLVSLDPTEYQIIYERELATLANVVLQVRQLHDTVLVNRAVLQNRQSLLSKAQYDYENRLQLIGSQAISNEDFIHAQDDLAIAESNLKQAQEQLKVSEDAFGNSSIEMHPLIEQQKAQISKAYYDLQHCSIYAPATGYVAQRSVNVGQWVSQTTNMMAVIPIDYVWVDANYKETQLTYMRIGQPAKISFDLYGSNVEYLGKVIGIASGSGSIFY